MTSNRCMGHRSLLETIATLASTMSSATRKKRIGWAAIGGEKHMLRTSTATLDPNPSRVAGTVTKMGGLTH